MHIIHGDFETRSEIDLRKCGAHVYAMHPSTEPLCFSWAIDNQKYPHLWTPNYGDTKDLLHLFKIIESGDFEFWAHNASFEKLIWKYICHQRLGWPEVEETKWFCTAAMASAMALPRSLEDAAEALGLRQKKDAEGHRVMLKLSKPRKESKTNINKYHQDAKDLEALYAYCCQDVVVEQEIHRRADQLSKQERYTWLLDQRINDRGLPIDTETVDAALKLNQKYNQRLEAELAAITDGRVTAGSQTAKMLELLRGEGVDLPNMQKETIETHLNAGLEMSPLARRVLELRLELSKASIKKYEAMARRVCPDGRIRGAHQYCGAERTGRWAGRGVQFQNLYRGSIPWRQMDLALDAIRSCDVDYAELMFDSVPELLASSLRFMVKASPGKDLVICDFAQIEARVLAWIAQQKDLIKEFEEGKDVYRTMACRIYNMPLEVAEDKDYWKTGPAKMQRFYGKESRLGFGYGMGGPRFQRQLASRGVEITEEYAEELKQLYRQTHGAITSLWYDSYDNAVETVKTGQPTWAGPIRYFMEDGFLKAALPSGRELYYQNPKVTWESYKYKGEVKWRDNLTYLGLNSKTYKWERTHTHGGKLVENVVQAISRDLLVEAMFRLERAGYTVIAHVHDEVICEVDEDFGSVEEVEQIMSELPAWAKGCPVAAEGYRHVRYHKR